MACGLLWLFPDASSPPPPLTSVPGLADLMTQDGRWEQLPPVFARDLPLRYDTLLEVRLQRQGTWRRGEAAEAGGVGMSLPHGRSTAQCK